MSAHDYRGEDAYKLKPGELTHRWLCDNCLREWCYAQAIDPVTQTGKPWDAASGLCPVCHSNTIRRIAFKPNMPGGDIPIQLRYPDITPPEPLPEMPAEWWTYGAEAPLVPTAEESQRIRGAEILREIDAVRQAQLVPEDDEIIIFD